MTNNTFQISRCWHLIKKGLVENKTRMIKCFCLFFVLLILLKLYNFSSYLELHHFSNSINYDKLNWWHSFLANEMRYFNLLFFIFVIYITVKIFPLSNKLKRIDYLSIPTSAFEKYISAFTINLSYIACFFVVGLLSELSRMGICAFFYPESEIMFLQPSLIFSTLDPDLIFFTYRTFCYCTLFISFVLVCDTCKRSVLMSATGYYLLSMFVFIVVFGLISTDIPFSTFISEFRDTSRKFFINAIRQAPATILYVWIMVNIVLSYFRLKKSQIV